MNCSITLPPERSLAVSFLILLGLCLARADSLGQSVQPDSAAVFQRLKKLNGEWRGTVESKEGPPATVLYRVTANGNTLMEQLFPGTDHEMISMYHLDGGDLVISHYCAMGNQPKMKLTSVRGDDLTFDFTGGTNLDPKKDVHVHSGRIRLVDNDHLEAEWAVYQGEKQVGTNRFFLARSKP